ncbi:MAG: 50S ribosomal protein L5 [Candidatus Buchananbacteria bacterium CG10_big_fil_rev_8_21_14_0_10_42_9]|uniref:Large ribosomal subunit protein uL5 n=1 Tax=Candidatus Buchananbacteria bacterium CG10_big_fil_rev_8_21_14_0_10_42_9 TaxID=1974526 RepID=A0A2H0W241_9BACT|nr:MAG: 50S ribosomal protein L5 [Candidatus Buchananbacteria bacterium CG10_big_fil_rev_8_21_14_0_10_42_9]
MTNTNKISNRVKAQEKFKTQVAPALMKDLNLSNAMSVPKINKIVLNVGLGKGLTDPKYNEVVEQTLLRITGQKPIFTKAKKAISNFKIKEGNIVGAKVTLRGPRMYDFLDKLINSALPRVRDFRGISKKLVDEHGNLSLGLKEHIAFPEIRSDEVEKIHGMQITIDTSAQTHNQGVSLLEHFGFPFTK